MEKVGEGFDHFWSTGTHMHHTHGHALSAPRAHTMAPRTGTHDGDMGPCTGTHDGATVGEGWRREREGWRRAEKEGSDVGTITLRRARDVARVAHMCLLRAFHALTTLLRTRTRRRCHRRFRTTTHHRHNRRKPHTIQGG